MKLLYDHNHDETGYFVVGDQKFYNKYQAILWSERTPNTHVKFVLNDDLYGQLDWTKEPEESLDQLYAERAWELRNKYDYLILHFSNGYDSSNILNTFVKHNIPLDEIFIRGCISQVDLDPSNRSATNAHAECVLSALPVAQWVKDNFMPGVKINMKDTVPLVVSYWEQHKDWADQLIVNDLSPAAGHRNYDEMCPEYAVLTDQGKKICHIKGIEKPRLYYDDQGYHIKFLDKHVFVHTTHRSGMFSDMPVYNELFYWGPNCARLIAKQCHTIVNHIQSKKLDRDTVLSLTGNAFHDFTASVIYQTLPMPFYPEKDNRDIRSLDSWFFKDPNSLHFQNWQKGLDYLFSKISKDWQHETKRQGFKGTFSRPYYLGRK